MHRFSLIFPILLALSFSACDNRSGVTKKTPSEDICIAKKRTAANTKELQKELKQIQKELEHPCTVQCCQLYVEKVINEGSDVLGLPAGSMAKGYATPEDARKIAAYVMTLSGRKPMHPEYIKEGNLYFNGNCGGCHGNDGKGLGGTHPNLTLKELKGVKIRKKMRIEALKKMLKTG
jgi:hypothetical protein